MKNLILYALIFAACLTCILTGHPWFAFGFFVCLFCVGSTKDDCIEFAEWIPRHAQPVSNNRNWILNADKREYTTTELYKIYKNT